MHLLIISDGDSKYGSANSLYGLVKELKKIDSSLKISIALTMNSEKLEAYTKLGCNAFKVPYDFYYRTLSYEKWKRPLSLVKHFPLYVYGRIFALNILEKNVDLNTVDIIHVNTTREDLSWDIKKKYNIPLIMHIREFGDLDYKGFSYRSNYIKHMNECVDAFIAISDVIREHWIDKGINKSKIHRIYNGVNKNPNYKTVYPVDADLLHFVIMGALLETKGQHIAIEALSKLPDYKKEQVKLDLLGDPSNSYGDKLHIMVENYKLGNIVNFRGYIDNPSSQINQYDCGLMCSRSEGFGRVTAEYMMGGLCVIASKSGANEELIKNQYSGLLYEDGNSDDLSKKIEYLVNNKHLITKYGINAREYAEESFTTERNAEDIYSLYKSLW